MLGISSRPSNNGSRLGSAGASQRETPGGGLDFGDRRIPCDSGVAARGFPAELHALRVLIYSPV